jgi:phage replication O-like protein O
MASPQAENGHIDVAHEVAEAVMKTNFSAYQTRIIFAVWRKTWGWHKKSDWIPLSQFVEMTEISKSHVSRTLRELIDRNVIIKIDNEIAFNKDYEQWRELPKGVRGYQTRQAITDSGNAITDSGNDDYQLGRTQKKYSKETFSKEILQKKYVRADFEKFWSVYPKRKSKGAAEKAFFKVNPDEQLLGIMITAIEQAKASTAWIEEKGKYIPYPASWLNARGWEDEEIELHPLAGRVSDVTLGNLATMERWRPSL